METSDIISIIIAAAAFFTAVIGPLLSSLIQCRHESKMYEKRFKTEHEHEAIERYIKVVGKNVFSINHDNMEDFSEASAEIFMYAPMYLWDDIRKINNMIASIYADTDYQSIGPRKREAQTVYFSLCEKFSDLRRTSKHKRRRSRRKRN